MMEYSPLPPPPFKMSYLRDTPQEAFVIIIMCRILYLRRGKIAGHHEESNSFLKVFKKILFFLRSPKVSLKYCSHSYRIDGFIRISGHTGMFMTLINERKKMYMKVKNIKAILVLYLGRIYIFWSIK